MSFARRLLAGLVCCFGTRSLEENEPSTTLNTLQPNSVISVQLSPTTVPHASGKPKHTATDTDALQQIFRSASSVRGYLTASDPLQLPVPRRSSLDVDFKFGSSDQERKLGGRLGQLGKHLQQRLSEGRLSKGSSKGHLGPEDMAGNKQRIHHPLLVSNNGDGALSSQSDGLAELLMSRAGSEAGYDSDAKSIQTTILKSNQGTAKPSPVLPDELLLSIDASLKANPPTPTTSRNEIHCEGGPSKATSDHVDPSNMIQASFAEAVLAERDTEPTIALQRLSSGLRSDRIQLPEFSDITIFSEDGQTKGSNAPGSTGPLRKENQGVGILETLKKLGHTVASAQRDSLSSRADDNRASLVSNLDPTLIEYITKFADVESEEFQGLSSDLNSNLDSSPKHQGSSKNVPKVSDLGSFREGASKEDLKITHDSDQTSIHLYNMRISRNLASPSLSAVASRSTNDHKAPSPHRHSLEISIPRNRHSSTSRMSSRVAIEPNRRPSDPQTRRLFEDDSVAENLHHQWKTITSFNSRVSDLDIQRKQVQDDASSFYWSDGEFGSSKDLQRPETRRHTNSLAIGGRTGSVGLPFSSSLASMGKLSTTEEATWFGRSGSNKVSDMQDFPPTSFQRSRSSSMPEKPRRPPLHRAYQERTRSSIEADEHLSEISVEALQDVRRERLTEISAQAVQDCRNERLSEANHLPLSFNMASWSFESSKPSSADRRRSSNISAPALAPRTHWQRRKSSNYEDVDASNVMNPQESVAAMWHRSFKHLAAGPQDDNNGFLSVSKYDRDGRRRNSRSSSQGKASANDMPSLIRGSQKLLNEELVKTSALQIGINQESDQTKSIPAENTNKRKKSLLDLGRRFTKTTVQVQPQRSLGASTPLRDVLGFWGRFPSHDRELRCGSAGEKDGVKVQDFGTLLNDDGQSHSLGPFWHLAGSQEPYPSDTSKTLSFGRKGRMENLKSKSMTLPRTNGLTPTRGSGNKKSRKGLVNRWKKLYRSSSWELHAYSHNHGHRSSISAGASAEYPELECIPGSR